jgi:hypothetical protein
MRYLKDEDNRYRVNFMRATEEMMDNMTVKEFITYLENYAEFEDNDTMYVGTCHKGHIVDTKVYMLRETPDLRKEFIVTADGRVFYWLSLIQKIELIDKMEDPQAEVDYREVKEVVTEVVKDLNTKDANWKWRAVVNKGEVKIFWEYLQYVDTKDSHFTITTGSAERGEATSNDDSEVFVVARDEHDEYITGRIVGEIKRWQDGNLSKCVRELIYSIYSKAKSEY